MTISPDSIRQFLIARYAEQLRGLGLDIDQVPDTFDFLLEGAVDSLGILEMVSALEQEFQVELDLTALNPEEMTILGPLARYIAHHAILKQGGAENAASP
jgi:acyl carrier protein